MKNRTELALLILEQLIEKDKFGRPTKAGASIQLSELWTHLYTKENVDYDYLLAIIKGLHYDSMIDLTSTSYSLDDATMILGARGLDYYREKTKEFC